MAKACSKTFMPLSAVKEREFLSRPMGCKGVGLSYVRSKAGQGAGYYASPQSARRSLHCAPGRRHDYSRRQAHQDAAGNDRASGPQSPARVGQRFEEGCCLLDLRSHPIEKFSGGRSYAEIPLSSPFAKRGKRGIFRAARSCRNRIRTGFRFRFFRHNILEGRWATQQKKVPRLEAGLN